MGGDDDNDDDDEDDDDVPPEVDASSRVGVEVTEGTLKVNAACPKGLFEVGMGMVPLGATLSAIELEEVSLVRWVFSPTATSCESQDKAVDLLQSSFSSSWFLWSCN